MAYFNELSFLLLLLVYGDVQGSYKSTEILTHVKTRYTERKYIEIQPGHFTEYQTLLTESYGGEVKFCTVLGTLNLKDDKGNCVTPKDALRETDTNMMNFRLMPVEKGSFTNVLELSRGGCWNLFNLADNKHPLCLQYRLTGEELKIAHLKGFHYKHHFLFSAYESLDMRQFSRYNEKDRYDSFNNYREAISSIEKFEKPGEQKKIGKCFDHAEPISCITDFDSGELVEVPRYRPLYHRYGMTVYSACCGDPERHSPEYCSDKSGGRCTQFIYDHKKQIDYAIPDLISNLENQAKNIHLLFPVIQKDKTDNFFAFAASQKKWETGGTQETIEKYGKPDGNNSTREIVTTENPTGWVVWVAIGVVVFIVILATIIVVLLILRKSKNEKVRTLATKMTLGRSNPKKIEAANGTSLRTGKSLTGAKSLKSSATSTSGTGTHTPRFTTAQSFTKGKITKAGKSAKGKSKTSGIKSMKEKSSKAKSTTGLTNKSPSKTKKSVSRL